MPTQVTNYQCPACGGPLHFDSASGKLQCDYCGSAFAPAEIEKMYAQKDAVAAANQRKATSDWDTSDIGRWGNDAKGMRVYSCPSCGAELFCEETTAATSCPYCGNPTIIPGQFTGGLKPEYVLPFKLDKNAAVNALKQHYKGKHFLPRAFTSNNHINKIQGVYVPFWMFDGRAEGDQHFNATKVRKFRHGDTEVTETQHFMVYRKGNLSFEKVPVDASTKMDDAYMDSIEPYDYKDLTAFSTAYLPGYLADKYDVSAEQCKSRADKRCENSLIEELQSTVKGYTTCIPVEGNVSLKRGKVHYALLPVWVLTTNWNNKKYTFMMNGQTGKMVGDLPVSNGKFWGTFAGIAAVLTAALSLLYFL